MSMKKVIRYTTTISGLYDPWNFGLTLKEKARLKKLLKSNGKGNIKK